MGAEGSPRVAAVLLAGGSGTRLSADARAGRPRSNKVYLTVGGRPLLAWSLLTLDAHPDIVSIVVAVRAGDEAAFGEVRRQLDLGTTVHTVTGGASRAASEQAAFELLRPTVEVGGLDVVVVHDGARPFASLALVDRVIAAAVDHGAAIPGLEPERLVYQVTGDPATAQRLDSATLRRVQTPQAFTAGPLLSAYRDATGEGFDGVDTAEVVARFAGLSARVVRGEPDNIKLTTAGDVTLAEQIAARISREGR
ncbi:MAG: IspD/TarI family cytidylyltransferase [Acidimicrobiales bacterium]|nr:IspD/TarI family cytidylyltransferase [Acidimicrobiales bacterium]